MPDKDPVNTVNLAGTMPGQDRNGLKGILDAMIADPGERRYAVCEFYALYDKRNTDDGTHQMIVRWTWIEPVAGDDSMLVQKLLAAARTERMGELNFNGPLEGDAQVHSITDARKRAAADGEE